MKIQSLMVLPLAATLMAPAFAQQAPATSSPSQPAATTSAAATTSDQNTGALQPLVPDTHEGFWGKMNPFARKKVCSEADVADPRSRERAR